MWQIIFVLLTINRITINSSPIHGSCQSENYNLNPANIIPGEYIPVYKIDYLALEKRQPSFFLATSYKHQWSNLTAYMLFNVSSNGDIEKTFRIQNNCELVEHLKINRGNPVSYKIYNKTSQEFCTPDFDHKISFRIRWSLSGDLGIVYGCMADYWPNTRLREDGLFVIVHKDTFRTRTEFSYEKWLSMTIQLLNFENSNSTAGVMNVVKYNSDEEKEIHGEINDDYLEFQKLFCNSIACKRDLRALWTIISGCLIFAVIVAIGVYHEGVRDRPECHSTVPN